MNSAQVNYFIKHCNGCKKTMANIFKKKINVTSKRMYVHGFSALIVNYYGKKSYRIAVSEKKTLRTKLKNLKKFVSMQNREINLHPA